MRSGPGAKAGTCRARAGRAPNTSGSIFRASACFAAFSSTAARFVIMRMPGFTLASYIDIFIVGSGGIHLECRHYERGRARLGQSCMPAAAGHRCVSPVAFALSRCGRRCRHGEHRRQPRTTRDDDPHCREHPALRQGQSGQVPARTRACGPSRRQGERPPCRLPRRRGCPGARTAAVARRVPLRDRRAVDAARLQPAKPGRQRLPRSRG